MIESGTLENKNIPWTPPPPPEKSGPAHKLRLIIFCFFYNNHLVHVYLFVRQSVVQNYNDMILICRRIFIPITTHSY